jgi:hypothetical protein
MIRGLYPDTEVCHKAIFAVLNDLPMGKRLVESFPRMPYAYQIK